MSLMQVGLVDTTGTINVDTLHAAAAGFNMQVQRDLPQFWPVQATVSGAAESEENTGGRLAGPARE